MAQGGPALPRVPRETSPKPYSAILPAAYRCLPRLRDPDTTHFECSLNTKRESNRDAMLHLRTIILVSDTPCEKRLTYTTSNINTPIQGSEGLFACVAGVRWTGGVDRIQFPTTTPSQGVSFPRGLAQESTATSIPSGKSWASSIL